MDQVLEWLRHVAERAAVLPAYYPRNLRSLEPSRLRFDDIRQVVQVVEDRRHFDRWGAEDRERLRAAGHIVEGSVRSNVARQAADRPPTTLPWDRQTGERFRRAIILGDPGFGKTWLLRYEARRIAIESVRALAANAKSVEDIELPIYARLSDVNQTQNSVEDALVDLAETHPWGRAREFPEGITLQNILVHEPKPRNPGLAEAFKRIGLVEQTGRGVDRIFLGQLRFGRPAPDYARSDSSGVRVVLRGGHASLEFAAFVFEEDRAGRPFSLDELLVLNQLFHERRIDSEVAAGLLQKGPADGHAVLERLHERGLVEAKGEKRGRIYHLSAAMYRQLGQPAGYVRAHGISAIRQEAMVLEYVTAHGRIERGQVMELCGLTSPQAGRLLNRLCTAGRLKRQGSPPRWTYYVAAGGAE